MVCFTSVARPLTTTSGLNSAIEGGHMTFYSLIFKNQKILNVARIILGKWRTSLNVADMYERHDLIEAFIGAGEELGYQRNPDYNGAVQDGFGYYQITQRNGRKYREGFFEPS